MLTLPFYQFLFDGGKVRNYLSTVKKFLDANPNEVLTFIFTNPEGLSMKSVWEPEFVASGMDKLAFVPPTPGTPIKQSEWPTLGSMIDSGKRVVVSMDAGADKADDNVPYILPQFQHVSTTRLFCGETQLIDSMQVWEPPFSVTDPKFPCKVDRINGPLSTEEHMFMINHNLNKALFGNDDLLIPAKSDAPKTNSIQS
jgi:hypothetical protein